MVVGIIIGRKGSTGFPNKNMARVCGRPMCEHVIIKATKACDKVYVSTDDPMIKYHAQSHKVEVINRSPELCTNEALGGDVYIHAYNVIPEKADYYALMMCNAPTFMPGHFAEGLKALHGDYDSVCTVSKYNMYSPSRMRVIRNGLLESAINMEENINCDRDSSGDFYIYDCSLAIVKPRCLENIEEGVPPQRWLGKKIYPLINDAGVDVDYEWQMGQVEWYLKNRG